MRGDGGWSKSVNWGDAGSISWKWSKRWSNGKDKTKDKKWSKDSDGNNSWVGSRSGSLSSQRGFLTPNKDKISE